MLEKWEITIPELTGEEERNAYVYVPEGYEEDVRFPVLYMFDGHNLFDDEEATYGKSWGMLDYLEETHIPLIVAAVECSHHDEDEECGGRLSEYSPFDFKSRHWGEIKGRGKLTMDFYTRDFKSYIDANYPTLPQREYTFISGSSMGGLMSLYALIEYNDVFSKAAALSPSIGFCPKDVTNMIRNSNVDKNTVLYMDYGEQEFRYKRIREIYGKTCAELMKKGILLQSRIVPGGFHSEASWEKQIPFFMDVFFYE